MRSHCVPFFRFPTYDPWHSCNTLHACHLLLNQHCIDQLNFFPALRNAALSPYRLLESQEQHNSTDDCDWSRGSRWESPACDWWKVSWYRATASEALCEAGPPTCACVPESSWMGKSRACAVKPFLKLLMENWGSRQNLGRMEIFFEANF